MKHYLITDPSFYTSTPHIFSKKLFHVLSSQRVDYICIRDKKNSNYSSLVEVTKEIIKDTKIKLIVHTDIILANKTNAFGIHLPYAHKNKIKEAKELNLFVVASTHSLQEALHVQELGADAITYSPIFYTPNKGKPKGLEKLKEINDKIDIHCFALGGILEDEQILACKKTGIYGFASIRYFLKKVPTYV